MPPDHPPKTAGIKPAHVLQAGLAWAMLCVVRLLPMAWASALGGRFGRTVGPWLSISSMARRNIARAFPHKSGAEIQHILVGMWDNFGRVLFEFPNAHKIRFSGDHPHIEYVNAHIVEAAKNDGLPGIFVAAHMGNWELTLRSIVRRGLPVHAVFRELNNPLLQRLFLSCRDPGQGELIPKGAKGAKRLMQLLKNGEHVGMMPDQKLNEGIAVPFFGRDAMTPTALAHFARRFACPVYPVQMERTGGVRFRVTFHAPVYMDNTGDRHADTRAFMTRINAILEGWIRQRPDQWLWLHRRWPEN